MVQKENVHVENAKINCEITKEARYFQEYLCHVVNLELQGNVIFVFSATR